MNIGHFLIYSYTKIKITKYVLFVFIHKMKLICTTHSVAQCISLVTVTDSSLLPVYLRNVFIFS